MQAILLLIAAALSAVLVGCPVVAWTAASFAPPEKVEPQYELDSDATVLVFPDDLRNPVSYPPLKRMLARQVGENLQANDAVAQTVSFRRLMDLQARDPDFNTRPTPIDEIGVACGADTVIYVEIVEFSLKDDPYTPLWHGRLKVRVRVVDAATGEQLWPETPRQGRVLSVETEPEESSARDYGSQLAERLAEMMGLRVARLFYEHEAPPADQQGGAQFQ